MYYAIFALATAIMAMFELANPVIELLEKYHPESNTVKYKMITKMTLFFTWLLIAPAVFFSCVIPSVGESTRKGLAKGLSQA